jgi:flagellin
MAQADLTRVASNIGALNSLWALQSINKQLGIHQTRLSTGKRINSASDDPAGLTIATKLKSRSEGLGVALGNIGDAKNLLAVAEGGIGRITDIMISMKNKAAQAASDTMGTAERAAIKEQLTAYAAQIDDIVDQTSWNGNNLIDGSYDATALTFQTGADAGDTTQVSGLINLRASTGGTGSDLAIATVGGGTVTASDIMDFGDVLDDGNEVAYSVDANGDGTSGLTGLTPGTYTVRITAATSSSAGDNSTIELLDSTGTALSIDTIGDGGGNATAVISGTVDLSGAATETYDFGNGVTVTINQGMADGTYTSAFTLADDGSTYDVLTNGASGSALTDAASYSEFMTYIEGKLDTVNAQMAKIGAFTGRLTFKEDQVTASQINVEASYNRIMNANMAEEQVNASKYLILQQTSIAMLGQANQAPQFLLSLFQ